MKIPSSDLYHLVHSLTKSEKRYLKVHFGSQEKDYLQLLDALLSMSSYDEEELRKKWGGASFLNNLAVSKHYLYQLILKALDRIGSGEVVENIKKMGTYARLLLAKNLPQQADKLLRKAKKEVERYEAFACGLDLLQIEKQLLSTSADAKLRGEALEKIFEEEQYSLAQIANTNEYWRLSTKLHYWQMQFQKAQDQEQAAQLEALGNHPKLKDIALATNFQSKVFFHQALATYHFTLGDTKRAYDYNQQFLQLLDSNPQHLRRFPEQYLSTLNNVLIDSLVLKQEKELVEGLKKLRQLPERKEFKNLKNIGVRIFRQRFLLEINWALSAGDFRRGAQLIPDIEKGLERFGRQIEEQHRITFYYLIAYLLFGNQRYSEALTWVNLILHDRKEKVVQEIYAFNRILNLLLHYELQNFELLNALIPSTRRYLRKKGHQYQVEQQLFRFLQKAINLTNKKERKTLCQEFRKELVILREQAHEKRVFNYIDLIYWLDHSSSS